MVNKWRSSIRSLNLNWGRFPNLCEDRFSDFGNSFPFGQYAQTFSALSNCFKKIIRLLNSESDINSNVNGCTSKRSDPNSLTIRQRIGANIDRSDDVHTVHYPVLLLRRQSAQGPQWGPEEGRALSSKIREAGTNLYET